jgi:DNA-binding NarL/FixJ family response regulator
LVGFSQKSSGTVSTPDCATAADETNGEAIFSPGIAQRLLTFFAAAPTAPPKVFPELTEREGEILQLKARGQTNEEIARDLGLSLKTARNHVPNIFSKLQVADQAQAAIRAREVGLGS